MSVCSVYVNLCTEMGGIWEGTLKKSDMWKGEGEREEIGETRGRARVKHISTLAHCLA